MIILSIALRTTNIIKRIRSTCCRAISIAKPCHLRDRKRIQFAVWTGESVATAGTQAATEAVAERTLEVGAAAHADGSLRYRGTFSGADASASIQRRRSGGRSGSRRRRGSRGWGWGDIDSRWRWGRRRRWRGRRRKVGTSDFVRASVDYLVLIVASVVASVDGVARVPGARVEGAVSTKRDAVLSEDIGGEEVARLVSAIGVGMCHIVFRLGFACSST